MPKRYRNYRTGLATFVSVKGVDFTLMAATREKLRDAYSLATDGMPLDYTLCQPVKLTQNPLPEEKK